MRCRHIGSLEEDSDRNLIAPEQRLLHRALPIRSIVLRIVFQFLDSWPKPLESIVMVVGHAWAKDIEKGKTFMLNRPLDQLSQVLLLSAETTRDKGRSGRKGKRDRVHWSI